MSQIVARVVLMLSVLAALPVAANPYNIASGDFFRVTQEWAEQSNVFMVYLSSVDPPKTAPGVVGDLDPRAALARILSGTCMQYVFYNEHTVTFVRSPGPCAFMTFPGGESWCIPVMERTSWPPCPGDAHRLHEAERASRERSR